MGKRNWKPWVHLGDTEETLERLRSEEAAGCDPSRGYVWSPAADVFECADGYIFRVELAGVGLDHVRVEVHEGILHVSGERPFPQSQGEYYALELSYGPFSRTFALPSDADPERISAKLKNGLLNVGVGRKEPDARSILVD
ncbi:MAG: Hsp20/alpha crystallin family protein [Desulfovibrionaceae bacterium]